MHLVSLIEFVYWSEHYRFALTWNFSLKHFNVNCIFQWKCNQFYIKNIKASEIFRKMKVRFLVIKMLICYQHNVENISETITQIFINSFLIISRKCRMPFWVSILIAWCKKREGNIILHFAMNKSHLPFVLQGDQIDQIKIKR